MKTPMLFPLIVLSLILGIQSTFAFDQPVGYGDTHIDSLEENSRSTAISPSDIVWEMLGKVNQDRALADLRKLTGEDEICFGSDCHTISNRSTGSEGLDWAQDYVYGELVNLGYSVEMQDWSRYGNADQNIIAKKLGMVAPDEQVYIIAHMDGVAQSPAADDDGSGVVDILEMARVQSSYVFSRTVVLFFSSGEEKGTLGVQSYLDQLSPEELSSITYAVDVDMVGYDGNDDAQMELWHGGESTSMAVTQIMSETIKAYNIGLEPAYVVGCG